MNRNLTRIAAFLLVALGAVWFLQGIGVLGGSVMTGVTIWAWIGGACVVAGGVLLARSRKST